MRLRARLVHLKAFWGTNSVNRPGQTAIFKEFESRGKFSNNDRRKTSALKEFAKEAEDAGNGVLVGHGDAKFGFPGFRVGRDKSVSEFFDTFL